MSRIDEVVELYDVLSEAECLIGGKKVLSACHGRLPWPTHGIYFFFENGELRRESLVHGQRDSRHSQQKMRVVRVGTHALFAGSRTTLWSRLRSHRGSVNGNGNHRGSIFRLLLGEALMARDGIVLPDPANWSVGASAPANVRLTEQPLERCVSQHLCEMPFVWLSVPEMADRIEIESYCIALLSNYNQNYKIDFPSRHAPPLPEEWLGFFSPRSPISESGLWNQDHVSDHTDGFCIPGFVNSRIRPLLQNGA